VSDTLKVSDTFLRLNWRSRKTVISLLAAVCAAIFIAGIAAAYFSRNSTICRDGKAPVAQRGGLLGQVVYKCHNGQVVTLNN
jgi:hypothetical protein